MHVRVCVFVVPCGPPLSLLDCCVFWRKQSGWLVLDCCHRMSCPYSQCFWMCACYLYVCVDDSFLPLVCWLVSIMPLGRACLPACLLRCGSRTCVKLPVFSSRLYHTTLIRKLMSTSWRFGVYSISSSLISSQIDFLGTKEVASINKINNKKTLFCGNVITPLSQDTTLIEYYWILIFEILIDETMWIPPLLNCLLTSSSMSVVEVSRFWIVFYYPPPMGQHRTAVFF